MNKPIAWINAQDLLDMQANAIIGVKDWSLTVGLVEQKGDVPLYIAPQREWVGLTDEDLKPLSDKWRIVYGGWVEANSRRKTHER
jgi:hypothetical protein